ncbi:hypothetical protein EW146_g3200 [Bondarzewia mesenterica]|uniref:Uncharacterized protein n=1 Tax=Bondarzewia mesenterica TaxID=1095465 RepID=A0A4S4LZS3_9AGAM|nr:hypothetical protein EW146_g3200 [Bondarzewia mesenterica]
MSSITTTTNTTTIFHLTAHIEATKNAGIAAGNKPDTEFLVNLCREVNALIHTQHRAHKEVKVGKRAPNLLAITATDPRVPHGRREGTPAFDGDLGDNRWWEEALPQIFSPLSSSDELAAAISLLASSTTEGGHPDPPHSESASDTQGSRAQADAKAVCKQRGGEGEGRHDPDGESLRISVSIGKGEGEGKGAGGGGDRKGEVVIGKVEQPERVGVGRRRRHAASAPLEESGEFHCFLLLQPLTPRQKKARTVGHKPAAASALSKPAPPSLYINSNGEQWECTPCLKCI